MPGPGMGGPHGGPMGGPRGMRMMNPGPVRAPMMHGPMVPRRRYSLLGSPFVSSGLGALVGSYFGSKAGTNAANASNSTNSSNSGTSSTSGKTYNFCPNCGERRSGDSNYCTSCGSSLVG